MVSYGLRYYHQEEEVADGRRKVRGGTGG